MIYTSWCIIFKHMSIISITVDLSYNLFLTDFKKGVDPMFFCKYFLCMF